MDITDLLTEIAVYRLEMNTVSRGKSLADSDVKKLSQGLDVLLYKYLLARRQQNIPLQYLERGHLGAEAVWDYI
jgi:hypothetical protein